MEAQCGPLVFFSNFDSGNMAKVELVEEDEEQAKPVKDDMQQKPIYDLEYNLWTKPDCAGTEFENANRTWFHFGIKSWASGMVVKINVMNMNKQCRLYSQGMAPVVRVLTNGKESSWERIRNRVSYQVLEGNFMISFTYKFPDPKATAVFFAFCYPFSYGESQTKLAELQEKYFTRCYVQPLEQMIYFHRELLCYSLEKKRIDLITISSCKGITEDREERLNGLFPDRSAERAQIFKGKKVFFLTSRVHPGETPASFVFNGFLDFILRGDDPRAAALRQLFVFKLVPMLNPDGVHNGFYRTDSRGVNLNRVYLDPDPELHPSIFAVRRLILYHNDKYDTEEIYSSDGQGDIGYNSVNDQCHDLKEDILTGMDANGKTIQSKDCECESSDSEVKGDVNRFTKDDNYVRSDSTDDDCAKAVAELVSEVREELEAASLNENIVAERREFSLLSKDSFEESHSSRADQIDKVHEHSLENVLENQFPYKSEMTENAESLIAFSDFSNEASLDFCSSVRKQAFVDPFLSGNGDETSTFDELPFFVSKKVDSNENSVLPRIFNGALDLQSKLQYFDDVSRRTRFESPFRENESLVTDLTATEFNKIGFVDLNENGLLNAKDKSPFTGRKMNEPLFVEAKCNGLKSKDTFVPIKHDTRDFISVDKLIDSSKQLGLKDHSNSCQNKIKQKSSNVSFYIDLHGHASKRGCFLYANHLERLEDQIEALLFPKLMSLNSPNFDFEACNFSLKNMLHRDKRDGMSKEGSGRVAIFKAIGIIHSYTLECNYNTGRFTNALPSACNDDGRLTPPPSSSFPPKYTPDIYAQVGRALAISALDLAEQNPFSRVPSSEFHTLKGIRQWLGIYIRSNRGPMQQIKKTFKKTKQDESTLTMKQLDTQKCSKKIMKTKGALAVKRSQKLIEPKLKEISVGLNQQTKLSAAHSDTNLLGTSKKGAKPRLLESLRNKIPEAGAKQSQEKKLRSESLPLLGQQEILLESRASAKKQVKVEFNGATEASTGKQKRKVTPANGKKMSKKVVSRTDPSTGKEKMRKASLKSERCKL